MNSSQLVDIVFKVYSNREQKKDKGATIFLEQVSGPFHWQARGLQPLSKMFTDDQCTYCKGKGHWKK